MAYDGAIIALDLASVSGIAEGCPGDRPQLSFERFRQADDQLDYEVGFGRAIGWIADRLSAPRYIGGRFYASGEAIEEGLIRVVIEAPIMNFNGAGTNADALLITKGLWAAVGGFARRRGAMVRRVPVMTVRKHFLGYGTAPKGSPKDLAKRDAKRVCQALGWEPPNLDAADAAALWHWASHQWNAAATPPVAPLWLSATGRAA